jgi:hypothetical protein
MNPTTRLYTASAVAQIREFLSGAQQPHPVTNLPTVPEDTVYVGTDRAELYAMIEANSKTGPGY